MATALITAGQMKELTSACVEAIPADLPSEIAQKWIGKKRELGNRLREILLDNEVSKLSDINPAEIYKALGMESEYAEFVETQDVKADSNLWVLPVLRGATCNKVVAAMRKLDVKFYLYVDDLDKAVIKNDRDPNRDGNYVVGFRRTIEADEENKNLSASKLTKRSHKGITLLERLLIGTRLFSCHRQAPGRIQRDALYGFALFRRWCSVRWLAFRLSRGLCSLVRSRPFQRPPSFPFRSFLACVSRHRRLEQAINRAFNLGARSFFVKN